MYPLCRWSKGQKQGLNHKHSDRLCLFAPHFVGAHKRRPCGADQKPIKINIAGCAPAPARGRPGAREWGKSTPPLDQGSTLRSVKVRFARLRSVRRPPPVTTRLHLRSTRRGERRAGAAPLTHPKPSHRLRCPRGRVEKPILYFVTCHEITVVISSRSHYNGSYKGETRTTKK